MINKEAIRDGIAAGSRQRDRILTALQKHRNPVVLLARIVLIKLLLANGQATMADVYPALVQVPEGTDPRCFGVIGRELKLLNIAEEVGFVRSSRPDAHARRIVLYRLADRAAAERYLAVADPTWKATAAKEAKRRPPPKPPPLTTESRELQQVLPGFSEF